MNHLSADLLSIIIENSRLTHNGLLLQINHNPRAERRTICFHNRIDDGKIRDAMSTALRSAITVCIPSANVDTDYGDKVIFNMSETDYSVELHHIIAALRIPYDWAICNWCHNLRIKHVSFGIQTTTRLPTALPCKSRFQRTLINGEPPPDAIKSRPFYVP